MNATCERRAGGLWRRGWQRGGFWGGMMLIAALAAPRAADASTYRWQVDASGNWNDPANWAVVEGPAGAGFPNLAGDVAVVDEPLTAARIITIPDTITITIGRLTVALSNAAGQVTIARDGTGLLVFDNLGEDAVVEASGIGDRTIVGTPIQLAAHLTVNGAIEFAAIGEAVAARNITTSGSVRFVETNTYTGTTTVVHGELVAAPASAATCIPGPLVVGDGAGAAGSAVFLTVNDAINHSADVQVNADGRATFSNLFATVEHTIDGLTVAGGTVTLFQIGVTLRVQDLTLEGGVVVASTAGTSLRLAGSLTATSTAAGPAAIRSGSSTTPSGLTLLPGIHTFTVADGPQAVDLLIGTAFLGESAATASLTKNGPGVMQIDSQGSYTGETRVLGGTLRVNGNVSSPVHVDTGAQLSGTGTVGPITVQSNGTVAPGQPVGAMSSGSLAMTANAQFKVEILGVLPPAGPGYDRLNVAGTVDLGNALLDLTSDTVLPPDATFLIVSNDENDPVVGTFNGMPEGQVIQLASGARFSVSYLGGDGNDIELTNLTPVTYFLSEGATGTFFDEDVLIANPHSVDAPITMTFFLPGGGTFVQPRTVPAQTRITVEVDEIPELAQTSASVQVRSDNRLTLAVERTMFWDATHYGGHTATAVARPERQWLFAEGAQGFFDTYLLLANPNSFPVDATVTFLRENDAPLVDVITLRALARVTVYAGDYPALAGQSFGMKVETPVPITAERAMYFASTPTRLWTGGHGNAGIPEAATEWFHAEGASGTFFNTFILISNPQSTPAEVTLRFLLQDGAPIELTKTIEPQQRLTVNPAAEGEPRLTNAAFSTVVTSNVPVVSERAMYWPTDVPFGEGHASSGAVRPALAWGLAEGRVGGPDEYTTYILLANPNATDATVSITFLRESGGVAPGKTYNVPANTRFNVDVGATVPEVQGQSFGAHVRVLNNVPIVVERSLYWNVNGVFWQGGTNAVGSVIP